MKKHTSRRLQRKRILITNDDGYYAEGIQALFDELSITHDVVMVAPDREQSATSHSLTVNRPLRIHRRAARIHTVDGTPTDCVMLAIHLLFRGRRPDMIISGMNHGANMGDDVTYSGTVAAAIEGSILGIPAIAASLANYVPGVNMRPAAKFMDRLVTAYESLKLTPDTFLNVNIPATWRGTSRRYEFTRLGLREYRDIVITKRDPKGIPYHWIGGKPKWQKIPGSDFEAVDRGIVSITPLTLQFTHESVLDRLKTVVKSI